MTYKTDNFLDKNRDFVVAEHQALLGGSARPFVRALFPPEADAGAGGQGGGKAMQSYKFSSVGSRFKKQVRLLVVGEGKREGGRPGLSSGVVGLALYMRGRGMGYRTHANMTQVCLLAAHPQTITTD